MSKIGEFFRPRLFKIIFAISIFLTIFFLQSIPFSYSFSLLTILIDLVISYLIASLLDFFIKSRTVKITIAIILGLVTIAAGFFSFVSRALVCDPVHNPGGNGDGGMICDPVHNPS
jgi:hypothetical protein